MTKFRYRKALTVLALAACLWALPAAAQNAGTAAQTAETGTAAEEAAGSADAQSEGNTSGAGGVTTATGGAALVGLGAYSTLRRQRQDARDRRRSEPGEPLYFENHTRNGTLRPDEWERIE